MSVDISPDGEWIAFDLLAHIYRVAADGGEAESLTQNSGVAVNFQPAYSPDGQFIAFVSDRGGQNNLWVMDADGSDPRPVFQDLNVRVTEPTWTPDGNYIVVRRRHLEDREQSGIWMYHKDGGEGMKLVGPEVEAAWPSVSPDGRYLYFHMSPDRQTVSRRNDVVQGSVQLRRLDLRTGEIIEVTSGQALSQYQGSSGGAYAPEISPDGRWLAFARRIPNGTIVYKGHEFGPRTALWLRDLRTGAERVIMDPIEIDMAEGMKTLRVLPAYSWTRDGLSIVISQGGKIRRLNVASGTVETIPFSARVHRVISEQAYAPARVTNGPLEVKFLRWHTASPDGTKLAFQAVGRIWVQDLPGGAPRRLTPASFEPLEHSPAWSPDGAWLAFGSWDDEELGHLWKIPAEGGEPIRITTEPGAYLNPVWSSDGSELVVVRGSGATLRDRTVSNNLWYELRRVPAAGGPTELITKVNRPVNLGRPLMPRRPIVQPSFGPGGRLFFPETRPAEDRRASITELVSMRIDGSDRRVHLTFPDADEVVPSPDGEWVAFQEGDNVYLVPFPRMGTAGVAPEIDRGSSSLPVKRLSTEGGLFPRWRSSDVVEFGSGNRYFAHHVDSGVTDTVRVRLLVPSDIPEGTIALTGARIITLNNRDVLVDATVVVDRNRISCVGECDISAVDRVVDVSGGTIIPGLIDMHAHHHRDHEGILPKKNWESAIYLAYGVTTTLDNSMWSRNVFPTAEMIASGVTVGPRTFSTGDPMYAGAGPRQNEITSYDVAENNVNRLASWGATTIKQYMQPRRAQRQWIADIARRKGLILTAEGGDLPYNLSMIMDGHTGWEHPLSYAPIYSDVAKFFGQADAVYSATFVVGGPGAWNEEYWYQEVDVWKDPKQQSWLPWRMLIPHTRRRMLRPETDYSFPIIAQGMADIVAEGGWGTIGSHGQHHGIGSHWEVWMAASALGPMGALEVATLHGAHFLGREHDLGSIEEGKVADLLVLNSNPLDNIRNTNDIRYVMKGGTLYQADTLDEIWPERKPYGEHFWVNPDALNADRIPLDYWDGRRVSSKGSR